MNDYNKYAWFWKVTDFCSNPYDSRYTEGSRIIYKVCTTTPLTIEINNGPIVCFPIEQFRCEKNGDTTTYTKFPYQPYDYVCVETLMNEYVMERSMSDFFIKDMQSDTVDLKSRLDKYTTDANQFLWDTTNHELGKGVELAECDGSIDLTTNNPPIVDDINLRLKAESDEE